MDTSGYNPIKKQYEKYGKVYINSDVDAEHSLKWRTLILEQYQKEVKTIQQIIEDYLDYLAKKEEEKNNLLTLIESNLSDFSLALPMKETKTQYSYKFPSGTLVRKKPSFTYKLSTDGENKLIQELEGTEYVETKNVFRYGEYKKTLAMNGRTVVGKETGEVLTELFEITENPSTFEIK